MDLAARLSELKSGFARTFWVANLLELFERFSFYGSKIVLAVFLAETVGLGPFGVSLVGFYGFAVFCLPILAVTTLVACHSLPVALSICVGTWRVSVAVGCVPLMKFSVTVLTV